MSALGHKQTFAVQNGMSAWGQKRTSALNSIISSANQSRSWNSNAERFHDQNKFKLVWLLDSSHLCHSGS